MFTPDERNRLRDVLVSAARADDRITGAALTGSAALGAEDRWSDIDLALGAAPQAERPGLAGGIHGQPRPGLRPGARLPAARPARGAGAGLDGLPPAVTAIIAGALVRSLERTGPGVIMARNTAST